MVLGISGLRFIIIQKEPTIFVKWWQRLDSRAWLCWFHGWFSLWPVCQVYQVCGASTVCELLRGGFRGGLTGYEMLDLLLTYMYLNILNSVEVNHHEQKWWFLLDDDKPVLLTHRIYICPYIYHKRQLNEGKYTSPMDGWVPWLSFIFTFSLWCSYLGDKFTFQQQRYCRWKKSCTTWDG